MIGGRPLSVDYVGIGSSIHDITKRQRKQTRKPSHTVPNNADVHEHSGGFRSSIFRYGQRSESFREFL